MARDYGKKNSRRHRSSTPKQLLLLLVSFLFGYLSASIFDFTSLTNWVNAQVLAKSVIPAAPTRVAEEAQLPKPKFEFYTLLATEHSAAVPVSTASPTVPVTAHAPPTTPVGEPVVKNAPIPAAPIKSEVAVAGKSSAWAVINKESYLVQVASFRSKQEAEHMRATLALKGFAANIVVVRQQQVSWYRVSIGPFSSKGQAEKAKLSVARSEHLMGMIRKMDA